MIKIHASGFDTGFESLDEALNADIIVDWHFGRHLPATLGHPCQSITDIFRPYRMIHMVRDPIEMLLSGFLYHREGGDKGERWLKEASAEFGGISYHEYLNTVNEQAGLRAEMQKQGEEIEMVASAYKQGSEPHSKLVQAREF
ncbi:hypothetical protein CYMTET_11331 [Cymbomonas tetramitiformis]|uniref:Sulfotransferase n=1 Tax=Cymbomonas tetramitiformis TaxID=36881 RepID=A0AAE0LCY2_9CHLO|nr:hypothetical protein CYMTET_11331 [Cymbomonas tetramitiformis]